MAAGPKLPAILHLVDSLELGGMERVVVDLALAQAAAGHAVAVLSLLETGGLRSELDTAGLPVIVAGKRRGLDWRALGAIRRAVRTRAIDVVHSHNYVPNYHAALALAGLRGPVLVNSLHNMGQRLQQPRLRRLYRASLWRTARVAMVSEAVRVALVESGIVAAGRARTVPNGIPAGRFAATPGRRAEARATLGLGAQAQVIGCVGRLAEVKNHAGLLAELPALVARFPQLELVLLGDGPLAGALQAQAAAAGVAGRLHLAGARGDIPALLPALDVFVLPSHSEGLSIALLEAAASGLPIVATDVGGNRSVLGDGQRGLLVPAGDGDALRTAIATLLQEPERAKALGEAAREWVHGHASIEAMAARYARLYAEARG